MNDITTAFQVLRQELQPELMAHLAVADRAYTNLELDLRVRDQYSQRTNFAYATRLMISRVDPGQLRTLFFFAQLFEDSEAATVAARYRQLLDEIQEGVLVDALPTDAERLRMQMIHAVDLLREQPIGDYSAGNRFFCTYYRAFRGESFAELTSYEVDLVDRALYSLKQAAQYRTLVPEILHRVLRKALIRIDQHPLIRTHEDKWQWCRMLAFGTLLIQYYYDIRCIRHLGPYVNGLLHDLLPESLAA